MTEQDEQAPAENPDPAHGDEESVVKQVLESIRGLDDQPVEDHVAVFEHAHERLRRALDQRHG